MEPADLNFRPGAHDDARLEALLRQGCAPLPDDGFSARVLAALPTKAETRSILRQIWFGVAGAALGLVVAFWQGVSWREISAGSEHLTSVLAAAFTSLGDPMLWAAVGVTVLSLFVAFQAELRRRLLP